MNEYLVVYLDYKENYDDDFCMAVKEREPIIQNKVVQAKNIKEIIEESYMYGYGIINIIKLDK